MKSERFNIFLPIFYRAASEVASNVLGYPQTPFQLPSILIGSLRRYHGQISFIRFGPDSEFLAILAPLALQLHRILP